MADAHAYQILDGDGPHADLPAGFEVLVAPRATRPDWGGCRTVRARLAGDVLDERAFYGFFAGGGARPPPFTVLAEAAAQAERATDVLLFAPLNARDAYFWNVFEQGEAEHPGLLALAQRCFARLGLSQTLATLASDPRTIAPSNGFLARPHFWRRWTSLAGALQALAEDPGDELGAALRAPALPRGARAVPMQLLIIERLASFLLMTEPTLQSRACGARRAYPARRPLAVACDALKTAHAVTGRSQYRVVFLWLRGCAPRRAGAAPRDASAAW